MTNRKDSVGSAAALAMSWRYLQSWTSRQGAINGPVVHRCDLKRLQKTHDTAWTQSAVIEGLVILYKKTGLTDWLDEAVILADTQCARLEPDGSFRWAGHEDDRFSSLVSNVLADCALLSLVEVLPENLPGRKRYLETVRRNIRDYLCKQLYSEKLGGFKVNPLDYYQGKDTFVTNMNSLCVEALIRYDRINGSDDFLVLAKSVGQTILRIQCREGPADGAFGYSDIEPQCYVTLYSALSLRGLCELYRLTGEETYRRSVGRGVCFIEKMRHEPTGLWQHRLSGQKLDQYPIFVAGAGIIASALLQASRVTGQGFDAQIPARCLLEYQLNNGGIQNFIGYDHPDNSRTWASEIKVWEDVFPTPNWNAHAFSFLCEVLKPPALPDEGRSQVNFEVHRSFVYFENSYMAVVLGYWPPMWTLAALFVKKWRYAMIIPGIVTIRRSLQRWTRKKPPLQES